MPELLLALDVGTTRAKAALFAPDGRLVGLAGAPLVTNQPGPLRMEQDAQAVWRTVRRLGRGVLAQARRGVSDVVAIGLAAQRASLVVWDRATGKPLAPMVLWSDLSGEGRSAALREAGFLVFPQQAACKLEAVLARLPDARPLADIGRLAWGGLESFILFKLTGAHLTDRSQAWPSGWLDLFSLDWNRALIAHQGFDAGAFPALCDTFGKIATTGAGVFGAAIPIAATIADQQGALVAHAEPAKVSLGTAAAVDAAEGSQPILASPALPPFVVTARAGETRYCLEAMVSSAGSALDWMAGALGLASPTRLAALAAMVSDAAGAVFLPALAGLGAPMPDPKMRGRLAGLNPAVGRAHLARAAFEGVAFRIREAVEALAAASVPIEALGVDGGLAVSETFLQILADLSGRAVRRHAPVEATAAGAALLAGRGAGLLAPADEAGFRRYDRGYVPAISADEAADRHRRWRASLFSTPAGLP